MTHTSVDTNLHGLWSPRQVALPHVHPLCPPLFLSLSLSLSVLASFARSFRLRGSLIGHSACIIPDEEYCACIHVYPRPISSERTVSTDKKRRGSRGRRTWGDRHTHSLSLSLSLSLTCSIPFNTHTPTHLFTHTLLHTHEGEVINNQRLG